MLLLGERGTVTNFASTHVRRLILGARTSFTIAVSAEAWLRCSRCKSLVISGTPVALGPKECIQSDVRKRLRWENLLAFVSP